MKKIIIGVVLALILAIGGTFFYVISIDWNKHKNKISEQFYNSTGKHIAFVGNVSFKIFPSPYLNAINAKIYASEDKKEIPLLDIKNINAELSLRSLLKGEVNVEKMILDGVTVNINWDSKGLNWQGDLSADQRHMMRDAKMVLNSVSLKNATVNFEAADGDVKFRLDKLSGEVMTESMFGPFRIEGNYMKGSTPQGFAVTIGKIEDDVPTSLNAVLTHPKSNSYVRFDGSYQLSNRVINGNVVVESQNLSEFINDNVENAKISEKYNKPLVAGFDLVVNKQMINLSNIVMKYDETQGAGSIQMPNSNLKAPNIKINFEFADLALDPVIDYIKSFVKRYKEETFSADPNMKLTGMVKSLRASYDGQTFKDFYSSFEIGEKGFMLDNLSMQLPGNAQLSMKGNVYSYDGDIFYQSDISLTTEDLMRLLKWINLEPKATASSVYKKMILTAKVSGNFDKMQVSPYKVVLDNTTFNGDAGIVFGERKDVMLNVKANTLNFDNYIKSIPEEIRAKSFTERMNYRFSKLGVLNDFDMVLNADANLVIYEGLPFENVRFKGNILQSNLEVEELSIERVANTSIELSGKVSGFGDKAKFEDLQYNIDASDVVNMIDKFGLSKPEFDYNRFYGLTANGTLNGGLDNFTVNTEFASGDLNGRYEGSVKVADNLTLDGNIELKHPEVMNFVEAIGLDYKAQSPNLGLFRLKSKIKGTPDNFALNEMDLNAGYSQFNGNLVYDFRGDNKIANADLKINKFEIDKYLPREDGKLAMTVKTDSGMASFLSKPVWSKDRIDYTPYADWEFKGKFDVADLSYKNYIFKDAKFNIGISEGVLDIPDFEGKYKETPVKIKTTLSMIKDPNVAIEIDVDDANVSDFSFGGKTYSLKDGKFSSKISLTSKASSEESFVNNLNGSIDFKANSSKVNGINVKGIYEDVVKRDKSAGLVEFANTQIATGATLFDSIVGKISVIDGGFKIIDGKLSAENTNVTARGSGDIKNWTMDVSFEIKHNEPKYLQDYTLSMKNAMDNPDVEIDVSKLFSIFKAREDQKEAEEKARIETEKMLLTEMVDEQKKMTENLVKSSKDKINAEITNKIDTAFSDDAIKSYKEIQTELDNLLTSFLDSTLVINSEEATQANIDNLKEINQKALQEIEMLKGKIEQVNLSDLQKQNLVEYNKIVEVNNEIKGFVEQYNGKKSSYAARLMNITTDYTLDADEQYIMAKKEIDNMIDEVEKLNNDVVTARNLYLINGSISEYEQLNAQMSSVLEKITTGKDALAIKVKEFEDLMDPVIIKEEENYRKKIEEEENKRLIEENTGSISVKKTGKTMTIKRDIEDIKEANEEISNEAVRVIDFTEKKTEPVKSSSQSSSGVIKKGRINR